MKKRLIALLLVLSMLMAFTGCGQESTPTTAPAVPETTAPAQLSAEEIYAAARAGVDGAQNLKLLVTMSRTRSVAGETYTESAQQTLYLQGMGTEMLKVQVEDTTTILDASYTTTEFYDGENLWMKLDDSLFTAQMAQEDYLDRLVPVVLLDAALYEQITASPAADGTELIFAKPTAGESWLVPEGLAVEEAQGTALVDADGNLTEMGYSVSFMQGPALVEITVSTTIDIADTLDLTDTIGAAPEEYVSLEFIDAPALLLRAAADIRQTQNLTYSSTDTMISYAGGVIFSQQESLDIYGNLANYEVGITLQDATGVVDKYDLTENVQGKILKVTENDGDPASRMLSEAQIKQLRGSYLDVVLDFVWEPEYLTSATIEDLGSVYLIEITGNDALGEIYEGAAVSTFWGDEEFLMELADGYRTDTLKGYLSIDKYTELPVAFGFTYEGVHTLDGEEYLLTDQWDQSMFLGSNTAYETITEEKLPDQEPAEKATPLFYHVTGPNGQEMWLMGTIHVGDDRTAFLPQEIYDALKASDALAVEFDGEAFDEALEADAALMARLQGAYFYSDGTLTQEHLDEEVYNDAVKLLKATGNYHMNAEYLKPYLWSQSIDNFNLRQGYGLTSDKGVDNRLMELAREWGIPIWDIESGIFQIEMLCGYSDALQELLLQDSLLTDSYGYSLSVKDLFEKWCAGDEAVLREEVSNKVDTSELTEEELAEYQAQQPLIEEYNKAMSFDRNENMLQVAIDYLESGEVIFYAVGLAHLLDDTNGLVDALRNAGYTVELVIYG